MTKLCSFALLLAILSVTHLFVTTGALPDGFIVETVTSDARGTTGLFAPHPAGDRSPPILLIVEKQGQVSVLENPDESSEARVILDLTGNICTDGERGLQSIAIHPNFSENRFVYLFYAHHIEGCPDSLTEGIWNIVSRFRMNPSTLELDYESREEIWRTSRLRFNIHNGGAMAFGNDGKLWVTTGDSGRKTLVQSMDNTLGSIIRLNDDGTIPDDNPYTVANGWDAYRCADTDGRVPEGSKLGICAEVFAHGFRNPFRMSMDPSETEKVRFSVSDVGGSYWEELSIGGTDYAAKNYGWPNWEGPCRESSNSNCPVPAGGESQEPYHFYEHRSMREGAATAGSAFVPPGLWPSKYQFLFVDFIFLEMYNLIEDPDRACRSCTPPISGYRNETFLQSIQKEGKHVNNARMVDIFFGPYKDTQALYVIRFGDHDTVLRIRYNDIVDNAPPMADFKVPDVNFVAGTGVEFDGTISSDPDGDALTFKWDFGDGNTSNEARPTHQFNEVGEYEVVLKVTDTAGQEQQKTETVTVGKPPTAKILSPKEGEVFFVGKILQLQGEAYDHTGAKLDDSQLSWEVRKHHSDHFHPFLDPTEGNNLTLYPAPAPEDYFAATNSFLRIILVATDKDGLKTEIDQVVEPLLVSVQVGTKPEGMALMVDDHRLATPSEPTISWKEHYLRLEAQDQESFKFESWSDGITAKQRTFKLAERHQNIHANFCKLNDVMCSNGDECCSLHCEGNVCRTAPDPTESPTIEPTTGDPTHFPSVTPSTEAPTTNAPSAWPSDRPSTVAPTTGLPSAWPTARPSTAAPTTGSPLAGPTAWRSTATPTTSTTVSQGSNTVVPSTSPSDIQTSRPTRAPQPPLGPPLETLPGKDTNFVASAILSFMIAIFVLLLVPYMVIDSRQRSKRKLKVDHTHKLDFHDNGFLDVEKVANETFDDCSFANSSENAGIFSDNSSSGRSRTIGDNSSSGRSRTIGDNSLSGRSGIMSDASTNARSFAQ